MPKKRQMRWVFWQDLRVQDCHRRQLYVVDALLGPQLVPWRRICEEVHDGLRQLPQAVRRPAVLVLPVNDVGGLDAGDEALRHTIGRHGLVWVGDATTPTARLGESWMGVERSDQ